MSGICSDPGMPEVVFNGASGCNVWPATPVFPRSDLLLRPKQRWREGGGGRRGEEGGGGGLCPDRGSGKEIQTNVAFSLISQCYIICIELVLRRSVVFLEAEKCFCSSFDFTGRFSLSLD